MIIILLALCSQASASFSYKEEPYFTAYIYGDNHVNRGEETQLNVMLQNNAKIERISYYNYETYNFFKNRTDMLTTAYNVTVECEGTDGIKVLTPVQKYPALPSMEPAQLPLKIRVNENVEAGEYKLKLKLDYEILDDILLRSRTEMPDTSTTTKEIQSELEYNSTLGTYVPSKKTVINETNLPQLWFSWIDYDFDPKEQTITLKVVVDEDDVKLKVVDVHTTNMVAGGKGNLTLEVKNVGEKVGSNLYVIMSTPSGFTALSSFQKLPSFEELQPLMELLQAQAGAGDTGVSTQSLPELKVPSEVSSTLSQGSYYVGDLRPGQSVNVTFTVDISTEEAGYYPFQIRGVYLDEYSETQQTSSVAFGVKLREGPEFRVMNTSSSIYAGSEGDFIAYISPTQPVDDLKAAISVKPPLSATVSETFVGDVEEVFKTRFKINALSNAQSGEYPGKVEFTYNINDKEVTEKVDVGVTVQPKMQFEVHGLGQVPAGGEETVTVAVKNAGDFTVRDATTRITVVDPFSTTDDTAYVGSLDPGESTNVTFNLKADSDATLKLYALNLEVKYKDLSDEWVISDPEKMPVEVVESTAIPPMLIVGLLVVAAAVVYGAYTKFKPKQ
ncbi:MAG: COG1361 S-layer family protein [Archaeoglobaceae archaeon]